MALGSKNVFAILRESFFCLVAKMILHTVIFIFLAFCAA